MTVIVDTIIVTGGTAIITITDGIITAGTGTRGTIAITTAGTTKTRPTIEHGRLAHREPAVVVRNALLACL
jgi:hypothetical protein